MRKERKALKTTIKVSIAIPTTIKVTVAIPMTLCVLICHFCSILGT